MRSSCRQPIGEGWICPDELDGVVEVHDRLVVGEERPGALAGAQQIVDGSRAGLTQVQVTGDEVDDVVPGSPQALGRLGRSAGGAPDARRRSRRP